MERDRIRLPRRGSFKKRVLAGASGVLAASALLAACGSSHSSATASSTASSSKVTVVDYWNMWSGIYSKMIQGLVNEFNQAHPHIRVVMTSVPSANGDAKLLSAIAAGDPPDVFTEWNPVIGSYAAKGAIQPLTKFMTGKYAGVEKWLYPIAAKWGTYKGTLYGLPMSMNTYALYYNTTMLHAIGQSQPPKTFSQLMKDQAAEWKVSGSRVTQIGWYPPDHSIGHYACSFGASIYSNGKFDLASNANTVKMMDWLGSFKKYPYSGVTAFDKAFGSVAGGSANPFVLGHEGFRLTGPWDGIDDVPVDDPSLKFNVEAMPAPISSHTGCSYVNGNYNIIPKGAKHPNAAWKFMTWMAGYDNAAWAAKTLPKGAWMPPSPDIASQSEYKAWVDKHPYLKVFVSELSNKYDYITPVTPNESEYETASATALEDIESGKSTVSQALHYIDQHANNASGSAS